MKRQLLFLYAMIVLSGVVSGSSFELSDVTVEGLVYCRCKLPGYDPRVDGSPMSGIVASLKCDVGSYHTQVNATTDSSGYFQVSTKMVKKYIGHYCNVYVFSSPLSQCYVPSELKVSGTGSKLIYESEKSGSVSFYSAGLVLIGPANSTSCNA
ncbi:hypothetical protein LUZ61_000320 [Rhynchospora tenuis]|uniref:Uncharacterized protein n=1 Tax=Rhynchospora tenuis TaxID=198213 RepID=A0AAD5ZF26_9POAL|nr:hypothetical protein LUZ61_000320 [Rhynchospora tenuis]